MNRYYLPVFLVSLVIAFAASAAPQKKCYRNRKTILHAWQMGKMVDTHLKLKKKNNFKMYSSLLGIARLGTSTGRYERRGDTLILKFCTSSGQEQNTETYLIDCSKGELVNMNKEPDLGFEPSKKDRRRYPDAAQLSARLCERIK